MKKEVAIGFLVGLSATLVGIYLYVYFFSEHSVEKSIAIAIKKDFIGSLIALGAILNFLPFFVFLKKNQLYRVRGVLVASLLVALVIMITKFW